MPIDFFASQSHYLDHLLPVMLALPPEQRGDLIVPGGLSVGIPQDIDVIGWGKPDLSRRQALRIETRPTVVASYSDLVVARSAGRPIAYMEHGAGFSWGGDSRAREHNSYAGGRDRQGVGLILVPGPHPAERNRRRHPRIPVVEIGCPKLDAQHLAGRREMPEVPTVAITWHWDCHVAPETRSAWSHFAPAFPSVGQDIASGLKSVAADPRWRLIGHQHPRWGKDSPIERAFRAAGIPMVETLGQVFDQADLLVADATSAIYEFASLGRPVLLLDAPWYRRDVEHGLRFWSAAHVGLHCDEPADLGSAIALSLADYPGKQELREDAVSRVYAFTDGRCAERAADALITWTKELP